MAYTKLQTTAVAKLISDYKDLKDDLPSKAGQALKQHTAQLQSTGTQAEEALGASIRQAAALYEQHKAKADKWFADATAALKDAKQAAASYKKKPDSSVAAALKHHIQQLKTIYTDFKADSHDFGVAWSDVRSLNPTGQLDAKYTQQFKLERSKLVNGQQALMLKGNQLKAMAREAEAQLAIVTKAMVKGGKQHAGLQRDPAQQAATDLAAKLAKILADLKKPKDMTAKPLSIGPGAIQLKGIATTDNLLQDKNDLEQARGAWQNVHVAYQAMVTKRKNMEALLAAGTKGLRSAEKTDPVVKQKLKDAAQAIKDAAAEIKTHDKNYADAKKHIAAIEAKAKKKKIA